MTLTAVKQLFELIGGLGMFLYGMKLMADSLEKAAEGRMKRLLVRMTENRVLGLFLGFVLTAMIQSSSAVTVMVVGFVDAGLLSLSQAAGVIMGANIGTTATAWMVSMSEWGAVLKPEFFAPVFVGIGAFLLLPAKGEKRQILGGALVGFGLLFVGLSFLSGAIEPYRDSPVFAGIFAVLGKNPLSAILAGAFVTAIIQSSSASIGLLQTLAMNGIVTCGSAVYLILGQNIGTCVTAFLAGVGTNKTAKQAALIHLLFNGIGTACFGTVLFLLFSADKNLSSASISSTQISMFHTAFNLGTTVLLFPFSEKLVSLSQRILKSNPTATG